MQAKHILMNKKQLFFLWKELNFLLCLQKSQIFEIFFVSFCNFAINKLFEAENNRLADFARCISFVNITFLDCFSETNIWEFFKCKNEQVFLLITVGTTVKECKCKFLQTNDKFLTLCDGQNDNDFVSFLFVDEIPNV